MRAGAETKALEILEDVYGRVPKLMGMPLSFDGSRPPLRSYAPALGEHDREIKEKKRE
jgi:crotonobetainyl-CoA:carnitine CoA-transferase CaiB-like acyl-CoA transferase